MRSTVKHLMWVFLLPYLITNSYAFNPTPLRVSIYSDAVLEPETICQRSETKTFGLDLGIFSGATCLVKGVQLSIVSGAEKLYGLQLGAIPVMKRGDGVQLGIGFSYIEQRFSGIQISGIGNNLSSKRGVSDASGIEAALVGNMAGTFNGIQFGAFNFAGELSGAQFGLYNTVEEYGTKGGALQFGVINNYQSLTGAQIGIYNYSEKLTGFQLGLVNKALRVRGMQIGLINIIPKGYGNITITPLPFTPVFNASW